jgi:hypothetical protein
MVPRSEGEAVAAGVIEMLIDVITVQRKAPFLNDEFGEN